MIVSRPAPHDSTVRLEIVNSLAHHLRQYPHDIVDAKRLIQHFHVSVHEFTQALVRSQQAEGITVPPPAPHSSPGRLDAVSRVVNHLLQYPHDIVDIKRLLQRFHVSAHELNQALLRFESYLSCGHGNEELCQQAF